MVGLIPLLTGLFLMAIGLYMFRRRHYLRSFGTDKATTAKMGATAGVMSVVFGVAFAVMGIAVLVG